jgi:hypothetical protein
MKRVLAVGCSHGVYADPKAISAVLKFRESFHPDTIVHLGDAVDLTCFRSGAKGTGDEAKHLKPDVDGGVDFLQELRPDIYFWGNHEDRLDRLCHHPSEIVKEAARSIAKELNEVCRKIKCHVIKYDGIYQGYMLGGVRYMHGCMYSENAVRDHAETFGPVVFAHTHRAGMATGRRSDSPLGFSVGTLTRMCNMDYAKTRRSTLGWSQGFTWGYYNDKGSQLWLHEQPHGQNEWHLPG